MSDTPKKVDVFGELCNDHLAAVCEVAHNGTVRLCSPGGDIAIGYALADLVRAKNLTVLVMGEVGSAALLVLAAAPDRCTFPSTRFLHHEPYCGATGDSTRRNLQLTRTELDWWWEWANKKLASASDVGVRHWRALGRGEGSTFGAKEAIEWGLCRAV